MGRTITGYTSFNKPTEIRKGGHTTRFSYGVHQQRYLRTDVNDEGTTTTTYLDSTEIIRQPNGQTTFRYYIGDFAIHEKTVGSLSKSSLRYLHKDHLGSVIAISSESGEIEQRFSYDAWGKRRETALGMIVSEKGRIGYTGHEMLDEVGLIHMNGRVYDPTLGRFLSADPFIQDEWFGTQAFNRYSYVQNNPLSYIDPTGMLGEMCGPKDTSPKCTPPDDDPFESKESGNDHVANKQKKLNKEGKPLENTASSGVDLTPDIAGSTPVSNGVSTGKQVSDTALSATAAVPVVNTRAAKSKKARAQLYNEFKTSIDEAKKLGIDGDIIGYKDRVRSGGIWDFKSRKEYKDLKGIEDFGNFAFGATGAAWADGFTGGLSNDFPELTANSLMRGAGAYQEYFEGYNPSDGHFYDLSPPSESNYGDQFRDQMNIHSGAQYYFRSITDD